MSTQSTLDGTSSSKPCKQLTPEEVQARYDKLTKRREEYLKTGKGAAWWRYVEPKLVTRTDAAGAEIPVEVKLHCHICLVSYSATKHCMLQMQDHVGKAYTVHLPPNTHRTRGNTSFDCSCQIQRRWHIYTVYALFRHWPMIVYMGCIYTSTPEFSYTLYIHASTLAKGCIGER